MIGSLSHLIRAAAISAILDGTETITRTLLDTIPLDHAAESTTPPAAPRMTPAGRRCPGACPAPRRRCAGKPTSPT